MCGLQTRPKSMSCIAMYILRAASSGLSHKVRGTAGTKSTVYVILLRTECNKVCLLNYTDYPMRPEAPAWEIWYGVGGVPVRAGARGSWLLQTLVRTGHSFLVESTMTSGHPKPAVCSCWPGHTHSLPDKS